MFIKILACSVLAAVFCLFPLVVQADPIQLIEGQVTLINQPFFGRDFYSIGLRGSGLMFSAFNPEATVFPTGVSGNCPLNCSGTANYNGTLYSRLVFFTILEETMISGSLRLFALGGGPVDPQTESPVFTFEFSAAGIRVQDGNVTTFTITNTPTQTPEPATILLLLSGLPLLIRRR